MRIVAENAGADLDRLVLMLSIGEFFSLMARLAQRFGRLRTKHQAVR